METIMKEAHLEHANITVSKPDDLAEILCDIFDWKIRWSGDAMGGYTIHVGGHNSYLAIYSKDETRLPISRGGGIIMNLNHLGIVVSSLNATEKRVVAAGCKPHSHSDYGVASSFYFHTLDDLEIEVVSYD